MGKKRVTLPLNNPTTFDIPLNQTNNLLKPKAHK